MSLFGMFSRGSAVASSSSSSALGGAASRHLCGLPAGGARTSLTSVSPGSPLFWDKWQHLQQTRHMRERPRVSGAAKQVFTMDNPVVAKHWPPLDDIGDPISPKRCRDIMHHLNVQEIERMRRLRAFAAMPKINPGDLVEVKYELSRSQQTFAVFQGFCVEVRNKWLNSSFKLKNTYDGVGVEQLIPRYSPRLLSVRVVRAIPQGPKADKRPMTRNYRYMWHYYVRGKYSHGKRLEWRHQTPQKPGIMSLEPRIRRELANLRQRYQMQRQEARLPPYIFPGPYHVTRRQTREVKAEMHRRQLVYAWDDRLRRKEKLKRLKEKHKWGVYKIDKEPRTTALTQLPSYHPLKGNLPK